MRTSILPPPACTAASGENAASTSRLIATSIFRTLHALEVHALPKPRCGKAVTEAPAPSAAAVCSKPQKHPAFLLLPRAAVQSACSIQHHHTVEEDKTRSALLAFSNTATRAPSSWPNQALPDQATSRGKTKRQHHTARFRQQARRPSWLASWLSRLPLGSCSRRAAGPGSQ